MRNVCVVFPLCSAFTLPKHWKWREIILLEISHERELMAGQLKRFDCYTALLSYMLTSSSDDSACFPHAAFPEASMLINNNMTLVDVMLKESTWSGKVGFSSTLEIGYFKPFGRKNREFSGGLNAAKCGRAEQHLKFVTMSRITSSFLSHLCWIVFVPTTSDIANYYVFYLSSFLLPSTGQYYLIL